MLGELVDGRVGMQYVCIGEELNQGGGMEGVERRACLLN